MEATLDCHDVIGGTARHRVREALAATEKRVQALADKRGAEAETRVEEASHAGA